MQFAVEIKNVTFLEILFKLQSGKYPGRSQISCFMKKLNDFELRLQIPKVVAQILFRVLRPIALQG